jgi:hypothetical protein
VVGVRAGFRRGEWRTLSDKGEAGVFTIPVADVVKFIGEAIAKGH